MTKILWLIAGVGIGFVVAHQVSKTEQGEAFFADVDTKAREAELRDAAGDFLK